MNNAYNIVDRLANAGCDVVCGCQPGEADDVYIRMYDNIRPTWGTGSAEKVTVSQHYSESALLQHVRAVGKPVTGEWANAVLSSIPEAKSALPEQSPVNR
ncbi:predicted protein [Coccidioides posadasii str. Silveira]|uniref:Predicted protein n=1 Tax=Coccidioides posadasii (strain RMSCC 757 / Silveira) TaxID=443226 RepID=E9DCA7_COCPS|nr:predicted protein [Coccidioides posadasii str. Silveira]